jgi:hypothetical protein
MEVKDEGGRLKDESDASGHFAAGNWTICFPLFILHPSAFILLIRGLP